MADGPTRTEAGTRPALLTAAATALLAVVVGLPLATPARLLAALAVLALGARAVVLSRRAASLCATLVTQVAARTAALTVSTERMRRLAHTDSLTGLGNRHSLLSHLRETGAADVPVGVALLDLDGFKDVNDSLGHAAGDRLLRAVAERLRALAPADAVITRLGGDEFALVLRVPAELERAEVELLATADAVLAGLAVPLTRDGRESNVAASMGLAVRRPGDTADHLMRNADVAMYAAKDRGRRRAVLYEPQMRTGMLRRLALETDLRAALTAGDVSVAFQPVVELDGRRLLGFEALARWRRPDGTVVPPAEFVPLAEECGLMRELGRAMLFAACSRSTGSCSRAPRAA